MIAFYNLQTRFAKFEGVTTQNPSTGLIFFFFTRH